MTTPVDICNRALSEIGARATLTAIDNTTAAGQQAGIWYNVIRRQLLRAAPWGFARKTVALETLGLLTDDPPASPYPWLVKYAYPEDCLKVNYILPPPPTPTDAVPVVGQLYFPWCGPSRAWRFIPAYDDTDSAQRVILANVPDALGIYVADVVDLGIMDVGFKSAFVAMLASKFVMPLTGNVGMRASFIQTAKMEVDQALAQNANEAISSSDHVVDWIATRGVPTNQGSVGAPFALGYWYQGYDQMDWGM